MASIRKSLAISFAEKYTSLAITIVSVMVISRLLTPQEIGIFSIGAALIGIVQVLRDFGVGRYLIQEKELTTDRIRTAFTIMLCVSWGLAAVVLIAGPLAAEFYEEPQVQYIIWVLSISFFLAPFGQPVMALLLRRMNFPVTFRINVASGFVRAVTSIGLASAGYGALGLAWGSVSGSLTMAILATCYRPREAWVRPGIREWRRIISFGLYSSGSAIVTEIGVNANELILGRVLGFSAVGIYSRARGLTNTFGRFVGGAASRVAMPVFSKITREGANIKGPYLLASQHATVLAWPFYGVLGLMAFPIIRVMFGDQWDAAVPLVQILSIGGALLAAYQFGGQALIAMGKVKWVFLIELTIQLTRVPLVLLAAFYSIEAVAGVNCLVFLFGAIIFNVAVSRSTGFSLREFFSALAPSAAVAFCVLPVPVGVFFLVDMSGKNLIAPLVVALFGAAVGWFLGIFLFRHPIRGEISVLLKNSPIKFFFPPDPRR